jgi:cytochrome c biogenesis protein CcmG/thiol:disulfide interchange protein DsbE
MSKLKFTVPFLILFCLLGMLWYELFFAKPNDIPSPLIGEPVPTFSLSTYSNSILSPQDFQGHVSLLNVFASWCYACSLEADMLMKINHHYHVRIYGINYKDKQDDVESWLKKYGDPYLKIGDDKTGDVAIDFGVYGTPETFIISKQGKIVYRHIGVIDQTIWDNVLYPVVKKYEAI